MSIDAKEDVKMKCDELKARTARSIADEEEMLELGACDPIEQELVYNKDEVDAAIAELKAIVTTDNSAVIARLEEQLRKTQRALWLARAERAKETQFLWNVYCHCDKLYFCKPFCVSTRKNPYRYISRMNVVEWDEFWGKIKNKCLAKAEEYK